MFASHTLDEHLPEKVQPTVGQAPPPRSSHHGTHFRSVSIAAACKGAAPLIWARQNHFEVQSPRGQSYTSAGQVRTLSDRVRVRERKRTRADGGLCKYSSHPGEPCPSTQKGRTRTSRSKEAGECGPAANVSGPLRHNSAIFPFKTLHEAIQCMYGKRFGGSLTKVKLRGT